MPDVQDKPRKRKQKGVVFFRNICPHVKNQFKGACGRRGDTMQKVIEALMKLYIRNSAVVRIVKDKTDQYNYPATG